jgi:hypothetical protein
MNNKLNLYIAVAFFKEVCAESQEVVSIAETDDISKLEYCRIYLIFSENISSAEDEVDSRIAEDVEHFECGLLKSDIIKKALPEEFMVNPEEGRCFYTGEELLLDRTEFSLEYIISYIEEVLLG